MAELAAGLEGAGEQPDGIQKRAGMGNGAGCEGSTAVTRGEAFRERIDQTLEGAARIPQDFFGQNLKIPKLVRNLP